MFELPLWQFSATVRTGPGQWLAEAVATFGLLLTIFGCAARTPAAVPYAVGLYITAAYWFTASTSFANPAVTMARSLSDTFAGIAPSGVPAFIVAQFAGMLVAVPVASSALARVDLIPVHQKLERQRLEAKKFSLQALRENRTVRDGDDLRHEGAQRHVVAGLSLGWADLPLAVRIVGDSHEHVEARIDVEAPPVHAVAANRGLQI